jgi:hypothetical protein
MLNIALRDPHRPQANGKGERSIEAALRDWAYGFVYQNSLQRRASAASHL